MNQTTSNKQKCLKCQSFFASNEGYCSVCFKIAVQNNEIAIPEKKEAVIEEKKEEKIEEKVLPKQEKRDSCWKCQKKVGYLGFTCRCSYTFCNLHRHFTDHNCTFDYKSLERERLTKENPLVVAKKV
jgi:hypothetical protein